MTVTDDQVREAVVAKREAMQAHGYGSPQHRKAQKKLAALLRARDSEGGDDE